MTPEKFLHNVVNPTLRLLSDLAAVNIPSSDEARVLLMTIAGQESGWKARHQIGGPARGYWQFENMGGATGEMFALPLVTKMQGLCDAIDITFSPAVVWEALPWNDALACGAARLLLWKDPAALPAVGDKDVAWAYYLRNWRPGAPHPSLWPGLYDQSLAAMKGAT